MKFGDMKIGSSDIGDCYEQLDFNMDENFSDCEQKTENAHFEIILFLFSSVWELK